MEEEFEKQLMQSQIEVQESTYAAVAQELHDNIGQLLSSTKLLMGIGFKSLAEVPDPLKTAEQTIAKAIQDLRLLSKSLSTEWLHQFNLIENLELEKDRINAAQHIQLSLSSDYDKLPLESAQQVLLFRVVQEALQNCIKHAQATSIAVQIRKAEKDFILSIADNGIGFNTDAAKNKSLGLRNMEHRTRLLGGTIEWLSNRDGTHIKITIPDKP